MKVRLTWTTLVLAALPVRFASAAYQVDQVPAALEDYMAKSRALYESMSSLDDADSEDARTIASYYSGVNRSYVVQPLVDWGNEAKGVVNNYASGLNSAADEITAKLGQSPSFANSKTSWDTCLSNDSERSLSSVQSAAKRFRGSVDSAIANLSVQFPSRGSGGGGGYSRFSERSNDRLEDASQVLDQGDETIKYLSNCCATALNQMSAQAPETERGELRKSCEVLKKKTVAVRQNFEDKFRLPPMTNPPDPLSETDFKPHELAEVIHSGHFASQIRQARAARDPGMEDDAFMQAQQDCKKTRLETQRHSHPIAAQSVANLGKALKCGVLPSLATSFGSLGLQRLATGIGRAPMEAPEGNWDMNCDPREMDLYDSLRPSDPNVIAQQWGIPQMGNPPYIQMLRTLPPLSSPFAITPVPGGGYLTPFGGSGIGSQLAAMQAKTATAGTVPVVGGSASSSTLANGRGSATKVASSRGLPQSNVERSSRGLVQGTALSNGARQLSSEIAIGKSTLKNASTLRSGAANSRKLVKVMASNNQRLLPEARRRNQAGNAARVQSLIKSKAGADASRTLGSQTLGTLQGTARGNTNGGGSPTGIGSLDDERRKNDEKRKQVEAAVQMHINNMELTRKKAEDVRLNIQKMIGDRDLAISQVVGQLINAAPKKQADMVNNLRRELIEKDKAVAVLKAQYDAASSTMLEESAYVQNLIMFGPKGASYPGYGGVAANGALPPGFPTAGGTSAGRGSSNSSSSTGRGEGAWNDTPFPRIFDWLEFVKPAQAAMGGRVDVIWKSEADWTRLWNMFVADTKTYVERRTDDSRKARHDLAAYVSERAKGIQADTVTDSDTDTLVVVDMYTRSISEETRDLIESADLPGGDKLKVDGNTLALLRQARDEAAGAQAELMKISLQYKDSYPRTVDENLEAWSSLVPEALLY